MCAIQWSVYCVGMPQHPAVSEGADDAGSSSSSSTSGAETTADPGGGVNGVGDLGFGLVNSSNQVGRPACGISSNVFNLSMQLVCKCTLCRSVKQDTIGPVLASRCCSQCVALNTAAKPGLAASSMQSVAACHTYLHCVLQVLSSQHLHQMHQRLWKSQLSLVCQAHRRWQVYSSRTSGNCVRVRD